MDFNLSAVQQSWKARAQALGTRLPEHTAAADVIAAAARDGLLDPQADLLSAAVAVEALAEESAAAAIAYALHSAVVLALARARGSDRGGSDVSLESLLRGEIVGAIGLSTESLPTESGGRLTGRATWVGPLTDRGVAVIGARSRVHGAAGEDGDALVACAVPLDIPRLTVEAERTAALSGFVCGHLQVDDVPCTGVGPALPFMTRARTLLAAAGLGMGRRALREALRAAHGHRGRGAGGEQTVQGLLADAATELDAAMLLTWKAAAMPQPSLAAASMAKLAATEATQRAVARATQVVGVDSFRHGHIVERLAGDVRALELFAGRTEALRDAVAEEELPREPA